MAEPPRPPADPAAGAPAQPAPNPQILAPPGGPIPAAALPPTAALPVGPIPAAVAAAGLPPAAMLMAVPAPTPQEAGAAAAAAATAAFRQHMSAAASLPDASRGSGENTFVAGHVWIQRPRQSHATGRRRPFFGRFPGSARPTSDSADRRAAPPGLAGRRAGAARFQRPRRARVSDVGRRGNPAHARACGPSGAAAAVLNNTATAPSGRVVGVVGDTTPRPRRRAAVNTTADARARRRPNQHSQSKIRPP